MSLEAVYTKLDRPVKCINLTDYLSVRTNLGIYSNLLRRQKRGHHVSPSGVQGQSWIDTCWIFDWTMRCSHKSSQILNSLVRVCFNSFQLQWAPWVTTPLMTKYKKLYIA